jgi:hypothetical protein
MQVGMGVIYIIRHITTKTLFEEIKRTGFICPAGSGKSVAPEKEYVAFETYKKNKAFYKAIYKGKSSGLYESLQKNELIGLLIDEKELFKNGFKVVNVTALHPEQYKRVINEETFTTKWENYVTDEARGLWIEKGIDDGEFLSEEEFNNIGEYVFVQGCIPVNYIKVVEEW